MLQQSINNVSFIAVTAHFFDTNYELKSVLLACEKFDARYTAYEIASYLLNLAEKWKISHKIVAVVSDNGANIINAIKICN